MSDGGFLGMTRFFLVVFVSLCNLFLSCSCQADSSVRSSVSDRFARSVGFSRDEYVVSVGAFVGCEAFAEPDGAFFRYPVFFDVSDSRVVRVVRSDGGLCVVEGLSPGRARISCTLSNKSCGAYIRVISAE